MTGFSFIADTNFLIDVHEGREKTLPFLEGTAIISSITEIELLGWHKIRQAEQEALKALLDDCIIIELNNEIKEIAIKIRQTSKVKMPDAIIVATSIFMQLPLITSDKRLSTIPDVELILLP